jgi:hypothetical protein
MAKKGESTQSVTLIPTVQIQTRGNVNPDLPFRVRNRRPRQWGRAVLAAIALVGGGGFLTATEPGSKVLSGTGGAASKAWDATAGRIFSGGDGSCPGPQTPESIPTCVEFPNADNSGKTVKAFGYWAVNRLAVLEGRPKDIGIEVSFKVIDAKFHQVFGKNPDGSPKDPALISLPGKYTGILNQSESEKVRKSCRPFEMTNIITIAKNPEHTADLLKKAPASFPAEGETPARPVTPEDVWQAESVFEPNFGTDKNPDSKATNLYVFMQDPGRGIGPQELFCEYMS